MARERCTTLCTKLTIGQCDHCDALDASDAFWQLLTGGFLVVGWRNLRSFVKPAISLLTELLAHPLWVGFIVFVLALAIVGIIAYISTPNDFGDGLIVEAFGMVFDLLVIGCFVVWLNQKGEKQREIKRYQEEINDFLGWNSEEATHRIVGNIKRLNERGVSSINLRGAYLPRAGLRGADLRGANLIGANLSAANLSAANLSAADLFETNLSAADLFEANLSEANLRGTNLSGAKLSRADLSGAHLIVADLSEARLIGTNLSGASLFGANLSDFKWNKDTLWPDDFNPPPSR